MNYVTSAAHLSPLFVEDNDVQTLQNCSATLDLISSVDFSRTGLNDTAAAALVILLQHIIDCQAYVTERMLKSDGSLVDQCGPKISKFHNKHQQ